MFVEPDRDKRDQAAPDSVCVNARGVSFDIALFFQALDTAQTGAWRERYFIGQVLVA
jgi:hypothetical protein